MVPSIDVTDILSHLDGSGRFGKRRTEQGNSLSSQQPAERCYFADWMTRYVQVAAVFSEMRTPLIEGSAPVFLSVLICGFKV